MTGLDHLAHFTSKTFHILHPESDWSDEDWTGAHKSTQKETGETNLLSDWDLPKPQSDPDSKLEVDNYIWTSYT